MKKQLLIFTLLIHRSLCVGGLLVLCTFAFAQSYPSWIANDLFPDANSSVATTIDIDPSGNILIAGTIYDIELPYENIFVAKYNAQGEQVWLQTFSSQDTMSEVPNTLCTDDQGNAYITFMRHNAPQTYWSIAVQKYSATDGTILWTSELSEAQFNGFEWQVKPKYMCIDNNYLYVAGTKFETGVSGSKMLTMKLDFSGNILWHETHSGSGIYANAKSITVDQSGYLYVAGDAWNASIDYCLIKYDPSGNLVWDAFLDGDIYHDTDIAEYVLVDNGGNVYITGYNQSGVFQWKQNYGNPDYRDNNAYYLAMTDDGDLLVGGYSAYENPYPGSGKDYILLKYSPSGNLIWDARYDYHNYLNDHPFAFDMGPEGNVYISGITMKACYVYKFITAVKVNPQGEISWDIRVPDLFGTPWELAVIDEDEFVVAAGSFDSIQVETATLVHYQSGEPPVYEADMLDIYFESQVAPPVIDYENQSVIATVHDTANIEFLIPYITRSEHSCMYPEDGVVTSFIEPIWYNITSFDDQTEKWWIVHVEGGYVGESEIQTTENIQIFPNPAQSIIGLQSAVLSWQSADLAIYDLNGRKLIEKFLPKGKETVQVNVSGLENGVYFIQLQFENQTITKKLIIQK